MFIWHHLHASSLFAQLPEENFTLLCHLFGVLHRIHSHSHVNLMTASNLALCIAPNMLWRSSQVSPELEGKSTLQVNEYNNWLWTHEFILLILSRGMWHISYKFKIKIGGIDVQYINTVLLNYTQKLCCETGFQTWCKEENANFYTIITAVMPLTCCQ